MRLTDIDKQLYNNRGNPVDAPKTQVNETQVNEIPEELVYPIMGMDMEDVLRIYRTDRALYERLLNWA